MSKILTDKEIGAIIAKATNDPSEIICEDAYVYLLWDLGELVAKHFGGEFKCASKRDEIMNEFTWSFDINENVPYDGGVYKHFDTDVTWKDGEEF